MKTTCKKLLRLINIKNIVLRVLYILVDRSRSGRKRKRVKLRIVEHSDNEKESNEEKGEEEKQKEEKGENEEKDYEPL